MPLDYFHPFSSGDRPQPAPLLPSSPAGVLLYLGAGLDLYPVAARYANFSTYLYVDAKPRLTRAPGDRDHAAWRAPEDVARSVIERSAGVLEGWELVAPEVLRFTGRDQVTMYYVFATLDFELVSRASSMPFLARLLEQVEALYVHGLYISPETHLHLPALRTVYAIPGNASCADVDFIQEHDCTPPDPSSPYYIPTRTEQEHYEKLCAWAGIHPNYQLPVQEEPEILNLNEVAPEKLERAMQLEKQLEKFIGLVPPAGAKPSKSPKLKAKSLFKTKSKVEEPPVKPKGPPLRFILIDQITWDDDLPWGNYPPPPAPSRTGFAWEDGVGLKRGHSVAGRRSGEKRGSANRERRSHERKSHERKSRSAEHLKPATEPTPPPVTRRGSIPHVLPPLPFTPTHNSRGSFLGVTSLRASPSCSSLRPRVSAPQTRSLRGFTSTSSLRGLATMSRSRASSNAQAPTPVEEEDEVPKRISRPRSGGGAAQGLVRCSSKRPNVDSSAEASTSSTRSVSPARASSSKSGAGLPPPPRPTNFTPKLPRAQPKPKPKPKTGGYRVAKTVREAEAVWTERDRKERERMKEEKTMRERAVALGEGLDGAQPPKRSFFKFISGGLFKYEFADRGHAHTV